MEFKGTPAPWAISKSRNGHALISGSNWEDFCKVYKITDCADFDESGIMHKANAKLIAAAPELLEVLNEVFQLLEDKQPNWYLRQDYQRIKEVIKKATE